MPKPSNLLVLLCAIAGCTWPNGAAAEDDDREALPIADGALLVGLQLEMPERVLNDRASLSVDLSCVISDSRLSQCRSAHQTRSDPRAGATVARSVNGERLRRPAPAAEGQVLNSSSRVSVSNTKPERR